MGCNTHAISAASVNTRGLSGFTLNSRVKMVTPARSDLFRPGPSRGPGDVWASGPHAAHQNTGLGQPLCLLHQPRERKEGGRASRREGGRGANPSQPRGQTRSRAGKGEGEDPHPGRPRPPRPRPAPAPQPRRVPSAPAALTSSSCSLRKHRHAARFLKPSRS